jgi:hypothetical protein
MLSIFNKLRDFNVFTQIQTSSPLMAGKTVSHRSSPVLSRQELQRLILDMID